MENIIIKEEFRNLIPCLQAKELAELEESILNEGVRDKLVTCQGVLIDGHNRYAICQKHDIEFETVEMDFEDEASVKEWILKNQLGRRNLTDIDRIKVAMQLKDSIEARARERQATSTGGVEPQLMANLPQAEPMTTRDEIGKLAGVSGRMVGMYQSVDRTAPELLKEAMNDKVISINKAYEINRSLQNVPQEQRGEAIRQYLEENDEGLKFKKQVDHEQKVNNKLDDMLGALRINSRYVTEENVDIYIEYSRGIETIAEIVEDIDKGIEALNKFKELLESKNTFRRIK